MRTYKGIALGIGIAVLFSASVAFAFNSSIGYGVFLQLIGANAQIITPDAITTQLQSPAISAASTTGALQGGPLFIEIVATSYTGTSSPSNELATTTLPLQSLQFSWSTIPGATGYGIYVSTTTSGNEKGLFFATSTNGQVNTTYSLNSTSSPLFGTPVLTGTGFLTSDNSSTSTLETPIIQAVSNGTTTSCTASLNGAQFYNLANSHLWLCTGAGPAWTILK
jgi:hypothetical protein